MTQVLLYSAVLIVSIVPVVRTLRPPLDIRSRPPLSLPPEESQHRVRDSARESLYYCGLQARIAPFVLAMEGRDSS